ncbi:MAG: DegT/DnrJ/EryC1/StrS family aminotransferase [Candidatus Magnetoovum sp. WYHC-5]|nr:DegT/DnrJ/EryC1/StrS family aminotransferase [Candidatus Magnetoovum sp. WYHC-5]
MKIPVAKPYMDSAEETAATEAIRSGWVTQGPKVAHFEALFAKYVGAAYAIAVTSCTTALHSAIAVLGIGLSKQDEVIVPSMSFIASANSIIHAGATPVFVDVDDTCNLDPSAIEPLITENTKAIIVVHQMGMPAELDQITAIAQRHKLLIIEDAACAIGSAYKGKRIGSHGNIACFSFHPRKIITTGEGGMVVTDNPIYAEHLRRFRHHGMSISDLERHSADKVIIESYIDVGYNYRMTDIQAAIGICQMEKLPYIIQRRRDIAKLYNDSLSKSKYLRVPKEPDTVFHNYQSYWVEVLENAPIDRNSLMEALLQKGIATRAGIMAIHRQLCYSHYKQSLPNTERLTDNTLILPLYPQMTDSEVRYVIDSILLTMER